MITFKQYLGQTLSEAIVTRWEQQPLSDDEAMAHINKFSSSWLDAVKNGGVLYRGFDKSLGDNGYTYLDSTNARRTSKDTNNEYQVMMDASPSLREYPSRSNSFICTTSLKYAGVYSGDGAGTVAVMIPHDGAVIASTSRADMLTIRIGSPIWPKVSIEQLSFRIGRVLEAEDIWTTPDDPKNIDFILSRMSAEELLIKLLYESISLANKEMHHIMIDMKDLSSELIAKNPRYNKLFTFMKNNAFASGSVAKLYAALKEAPVNSRFTWLSEQLMTPEHLDLSLHKYGDALDTRAGGVECWFSGKAVAVTVPMFVSMLRTLRENKFPIHGSLRHLLEAKK